MPDKPGSINVLESGERLVLERRWFNFSALGVIVFAIVWNTFLFFYSRQPVAPDADPAEALLLIPLSIVALISVYLALAAALNRSRFTADTERLEVSHGPLPWPGKTVARAEVQQIAAYRYTSGSSGQRRTTYAVVALTHAGKRQRLIGDLKNSAEVLYIRQALNQHWKISAAPLPDEYQGW